MNAGFDYLTNLQYTVKSLTGRVRAFESGEKYVTMKSEFRNRLAEKDSEIKCLKTGLADANCRTATVRKNWQQVIEDMEKEHARELRKKERDLKEMEKRALKAERQADELRGKLTEKNRELYLVKVELEEEKGRGLKLTAQLNRDYENSSIPSSMKQNHKKIANSREKTDRKPGGQPGHKGHGRKKHVPTRVIEIPAPAEYADNPDYKPTGKMITKQVVNLNVSVTAIEYTTLEFRHKPTGMRVHADFPESVVNDVNYGGSIKAFAFLLNNYCCVSIDKAREFLSEITNGELQISKGMINGLAKEFSGRTQKEQKEAFSELLRSPVMGADFTSARQGGRNVQVAVCANKDTLMYFAREFKGHKGVQATPTEDYQGILIHDHDKTFYNYGGGHQECLAHVLRYLKGSIDYEPGLIWNRQMHELIRDMIHYRNTVYPDSDFDHDKAAEFEIRYMSILETAKDEYEYEPPSDYYRDGYNLYLRLFEFKDSHLLFLHDKRVPTTNNLCERLLRGFKRKQKQAITFRSFECLEYLCAAMGTIALLRMKNQSLYSSVAMFFD